LQTPKSKAVQVLDVKFANIFPNIFDLWLIESMNVKPEDTEE
jgi:hypothetical protein